MTKGVPSDRYLAFGLFIVSGISANKIQYNNSEMFLNVI